MSRLAPVLSCAGVLVCLGLPSAVDAQTKVVVDPDSILRMEVPESWMMTDLGSVDASVQMADTTNEVGLMLITESKADFFGWNMTRFLYVTLGQGVAAVDLPEVSEIEHRTIDGAPAAYARVSGATGGQQFVYVRVAIDAPEHYVQLILVSLRSAWESHRDVIEQVIDSVRFVKS